MCRLVFLLLYSLCVLLLLYSLCVLLLLLVVVAALLVGYFAVTNATFSALYVGLYLPLCRVFSFLLIKSLLIIKKKKIRSLVNAIHPRYLRHFPLDDHFNCFLLLFFFYFTISY